MLQLIAYLQRIVHAAMRVGERRKVPQMPNEAKPVMSIVSRRCNSVAVWQRLHILHLFFIPSTAFCTALKHVRAHDPGSILYIQHPISASCAPVTSKQRILLWYHRRCTLRKTSGRNFFVSGLHSRFPSTVTAKSSLQVVSVHV